ncbi:MAG: hypothetical protein JNK85_00565 [Verrucomicrobiales bacterium]|nr:hypothetical protein [Verrucomicrobiales bacterium]
MKIYIDVCQNLFRNIIRDLGRMILGGFAWMLLVSGPQAQARLVIVGETVHRSALTPGGTGSGTITVLNRGNEPAEVRVYQTDYRFSAGGESDFATPGSMPRSNASWLAIDVNQVSIAPNGTAEVNYRVVAPNDATLNGTYWSLVMIEQTEAIVAPARGNNPAERKAAIRTVVRHAIQIVHDFGPEAPPSLKVLQKAMDHDSRGKSFSLDVENRGGGMVRPAVTLELFAASGTRVANLETAKVRLYPGCSYRYRFDLTSIPAGKYNALAVLDAGGESVSGAQYVLDVP